MSDSMGPKKRRLVKGLSERVQRERDEEVQCGKTKSKVDKLTNKSSTKSSNVASKSSRKRKSTDDSTDVEEQSLAKGASKMSKRKEQTTRSESSKGNQADNPTSDVEVKKGRKRKSSRFERIHHRSSLALVVEAAKEMNESQREAASRIGLGKLLDIPFTELPSHLCFWIVQNYDARRGHILMDDGSKLDVTEEDVEICLGLPRGGKEIVKKSTDSNKVIVKEWRQHIDKESRGLKTRPNELFQAMFFKPNDKGEEEDEDVVNARKERYRDMRWFLRDYVILIYSCLLEPHQCGPVNQNLIMPLDIINDLGSYNWCGFIIDCLNKAKEKWLKNPTVAYFTGPLIFLTVHYLDRVVNYRKRDVEPRSIPAFIGWSGEKIKAREKFEMTRGGFGLGMLEPQQTIKPVGMNDGPALLGPSVGHEPQSMEPGQPSIVPNSQDFNKSLGEDFKNLLKIVIRISEKTAHIPDKTNKVSIALAEASKSVLGATTGALTQVDAPTQFQKAMDTFDKMWNDDELEQVMLDYENALVKREAFVETDFPNLFGLITAGFPPTPVGGNVSPSPPTDVGRSENFKGILRSDDGDGLVNQDGVSRIISTSNPVESDKGPHSAGMSPKPQDEVIDTSSNIVEKDLTDNIDRIVDGIAQKVISDYGAGVNVDDMVAEENVAGTDKPHEGVEEVVLEKAKTKKPVKVYSKKKVNPRRSDRLKK